MGGSEGGKELGLLTVVLYQWSRMQRGKKTRRLWLAGRSGAVVPFFSMGFTIPGRCSTARKFRRRTSCDTAKGPRGPNVRHN